jgi:hypothetical protein
MFGLHFWQALFEGKRWARRQALEAVMVLVVCGVVIGATQLVG